MSTNKRSLYNDAELSIQAKQTNTIIEHRIYTTILTLGDILFRCFVSKSLKKFAHPQTTSKNKTPHRAYSDVYCPTGDVRDWKNVSCRVIFFKIYKIWTWKSPFWRNVWAHWNFEHLYHICRKTATSCLVVPLTFRLTMPLNIVHGRTHAHCRHTGYRKRFDSLTDQ